MNKIISLILIATMVFSFAGCSSKETKATTKETTKQSSTTTKKEKTTTSKSSNITTKQTTESGTKSTGGATAKVEAKTTTGTTKSVPGESATVETKTTTTTTAQTERLYTLEEAYAYRDRLKAYAISIGLKWNENITEDIGAGVGEYLAISPKRDINYRYEKHCNDIKCAAESDGYHEINIIVTPEGRPGYYCLNNLFW